LKEVVTSFQLNMAFKCSCFQRKWPLKALDEKAKLVRRKHGPRPVLVTVLLIHYW